MYLIDFKLWFILKLFTQSAFPLRPGQGVEAPVLQALFTLVP
jgi:hypothetical protein